jgi:hypothetical protein
MGRGETIILVLFVVVFLFSSFMLLSGWKITGFATSGSTTSNVTVSKAFSISLSDNLTAGIGFGNVSTETDINATVNYIVDKSNETEYFVNTSSTDTVNVDLCVSANGPLNDSSSGDTIGLGNYTYANATYSNRSEPANAQSTAMSTTDTKAGESLTPGGGIYYRFWLDITAEIPSGVYNNTITFTGVEENDACS